jgi:hypothetical protein
VDAPMTLAELMAASPVGTVNEPVAGGQYLQP